VRQAIYSFLCWQCCDNEKMQWQMFANIELVKSHLGLDVVDADKLLGGICKNNMYIVDKVGKEWIRLLFFDLIKRYRCARIQWLQILHYLMKCKGKPLKSNQVHAPSLHIHFLLHHCVVYHTWLHDSDRMLLITLTSIREAEAAFDTFGVGRLL
jgi:hypothetical protein